jgi:hypothetical protein
MIQLLTNNTEEHSHRIALQPSDLQVYEDATLPDQICCLDVHISCQRRLIKPLVAEFERQFVDGTVSIYDYGYSSRFQQGYIILSWDKRIPLSFKQQLDADSRLDGYTIYVLPEDQSYGPLNATGEAE